MYAFKKGDVHPMKAIAGCQPKTFLTFFFDGETFLFFWKTFLNLFYFDKKTFFSGFLWKMY